MVAGGSGTVIPPALYPAFILCPHERFAGLISGPENRLIAPSGPEFDGVRVNAIAFGDTEDGWFAVPSKPRRGCPADGSGP